MSQNIDIDAFRKAYYARMGGQAPAPHEQEAASAAPDADSVPWDGVTDMGDIEPLNIGGQSPLPPPATAKEPGMSLPAERVAKVFEEWKTPIEARAEYEASTLGETLDAIELSDEDTFALKALHETPLPDSRPFSISPGNGDSPGDMDIHLARMRHRGVVFDRRSFDWNLQTVHALHNSLKTNAFELKRLADRSELPYSVVEEDPDFARKKILSDEHAERLRLFAQKNEIPTTIDFLRQRDPVEQVALTSDVALAALEKDLPAGERGFFESGYIGAARNAWEYGMMARELGELGVKWMDGSITDEERRRIDVLQKTLGYGQRQRENQALLERMVRGTVEALGVPLYGGLEGSVEFLGRYGKEGLAGGAMVGAGFGTAAGGVGAVPGAIAGGLTGLSAVAQAGFVNDMMRQEGAQTFLTLMDKGVPEELARVLAIGAGAAKGALEYVGLKQLGKVFPGVERILTPEAASAALNAIKKNPSLAAAVGEGALAFLRGITGETATEVLQEGVDIAAEEAGRRLSGINEAAPTAGEIVGRLTDTTVQTVESTALVAFFGGVNRGVYQHRRASKLEDLQETQSKTLDTVAEAVQKSPVMQDMPGTGEALLDHLAESGVLPKQVFIRPEAVQQTFFQTEDPERMAAAADMGITPESLQENLTLGTDVAVDMSKATAHILKDADLYAALKPDMRLSPDMLTDAEVEDLTAMSADAQARLDYLNDILAPLSEEVADAENRYQQRMEIAEPYMEQWRAAGYTENQAEAFGLVLAASAERMAPLFGKTPQEYLEERLAGYFPMTQEEFENLHEGGLDAMFENRETAALLQEMGVRRGMSHTARRRALQPEFAYVYGKVSPESVQNLYGMERYKELRRQFGPGFFAKKGEGVHIDVLAHGFMSEERGAYDQNRDAVDVDEFAEKVFMPHDEFEGGIGSLLRGQAFYQRFAGQNTESPAFKKWFGKSKVVDENGEPLTVYHGTGAAVGEDFGFDYKFIGHHGSAEGYGFYFTTDENTANGYQKEDGSLVKAYLSLQKPMPLKQKPFSKTVLKNILKRMVKKEIEQFPDETPDYRDSFLSNYADTYGQSFDQALNEAVNMIHDADTALDQIIEIANASGNKRGTAEAVREVTGYDSVFSNGYGDMGGDGGKIYVAWFPEQGKSVENRGTWNAADPRIFFQSAYHGSPYHFDQFTLDHMGRGEGAQVHGWGLYFAADKNVSEEYRKRLGSTKYYDGKRELGGMEARAARFLLNDAGEKRPLAEAEAEVRKYTDPGAEQDQLLAHVRELMEKDVTRKNGQLYEVNIPENDELLDEQKTLAEQAESVKEALERGADSMPDEEIEANMAEYLYQALEDGENVTGRKLYQALAQLGTVDYEETLEISSDGARAASEFLNSLGIKGITYVGHEDGRCFVVFDDKAISILNTFYQNRKPVEVSSKALGVPEGAPLRDYIKAAREVYRKFQSSPAQRADLGEILFTGQGFREMSHTGADKRKWQLVPVLKEIIEQGEYLGSRGLGKERTDSKVAFHWIEADVLLDGKPLRVGVNITEDAQGRKFYNINQDLVSFTAKKEALAGHLESSVGLKQRFQDGNPSDENTVTTESDGVNLHIFESRPTGRAQGAIRPLDDGRYVVGLFKSKNASTVLHETAHFWLEELRRAAGLETAPEWVREAWAKLEKAYGFEGASLTPEKWREVQERFAREFEAYAREGKAPSWELQTAFSRFRNWLTDIYRSIKAILGVHEVSPEVREVFDALLATDEEIEQSRRAVERGSVMERLGGEVAPELRDKYARAVQKAHENASAVIANRRLVDRRKAERDLREKATAAIDGSETYKLIARLREEGIPFDALKGAISEDLAYRLREKWRRARGEGRALIRKGGTLDILDVAAQFNEDTAQGLAAVLLDTPTRREAIDAQVEAGLAEWDAAYDAEVEYSSAYDEVLALEMEALTGERQVSPAALRRQMDERTDARKMSQVDAEYQALKARLRSEERSTRRAAREARQETNAAWRERMAELKEKERLRRAALGAAYRARLERDAIVRQLRKVGDSKSVPYEYMCQIRRLLGRFDGLGTPGQRLDPATLRSGLPSLQEFLATRMTGPLGEETTAPEWLLGEKAGRFSDLSLEEMREVKRLVMELAHAGRTEGRMLADAEKRATREVAEGCAEQMGTLSQRKFISERAGLLDTVRGALRKGLSSITSMRFLARWMDGFAQGGVNQKAWFMPLQQALSDELTLKREMEQLLRAAVTPLLKVGRLTEAFAIDGVPLQEDVQRLWKGLFDMDKVYSVALNMGNAGNLKALMAGYGWSEADLARITARLTAEEWQAIQAVWDAINTLYPRLDATYRALKGVPLPKVKAQAFTVITADGQRLRLKGGYYPLIFDQRLSGKAAENQSVDEMLNGTEAVLRTPNPKSGMTNARKGGTLPPLLSMTVIDRHVADTIHYITHALPLRDTMRLFREPAFKAAFINAAGQENYDQLLPWLRGIARPDGEQMHGIMKAMDWMAKRGTMFAMGLNMKSALLQLTSIGNSWSEVGTGNFMRAAATLLSGPRESWETIRRKSAYMQSRAQFMDESLRREYAEMRANGVGGVRFRNARYALAVVQKAQFALISALDTAVAAPTWLAAYDKAIARGAEESAAVAEADAAVVAAQGGGGALDTPAVMRQAGIMRILCPFMSFALSDFNRKLETVRGLREYQKTGNSAITYGRAFSDFALQWVMPVVLSCLMVGLGRDDEWPDAEDYGWEALTFFTMGIPLARDVARMAQDQFSGSGFKGGRTPLTFTGVDNLLRGAKHARQALVDDKADAGYLALKESLNAVGFFLGIGTPQIWRTVEGSEAYFVDDEGGVLAPLLGKPGKK